MKGGSIGSDLAGNPLGHGVRRLAEPLSGQLLVVHSGHVGVDVDRIEQWTGDALLVTRHDIGRADAALLAVAVVVAWAGVFAKRTLYGIARKERAKGMFVGQVELDVISLY
jgi:hypothetical protein